MAEMILVKVAPLGKPVVEVMVPENSTVGDALRMAAINTSGFEDIRKNSKPVNAGDTVLRGDIITLVPAIRGGI